MTLLRRLAREPLLHFILIGGAIFFGYSKMGPGETQPGDVIFISTGQITKITAGFEAAWGRPPTDDEMQSLIENTIREEVYYRDALELALDKNDTVIRRRLRQKMEFLADRSFKMEGPSEQDLREYFDENKTIYRRAPRLAFDQVFFETSTSAQSILSTLEKLRADKDGAIPVIGDQTFLPPHVKLSPARGVDSLFGRGFFDRIIPFEAGIWSGPVRSGFGLHLVRVTERLQADVPALEQVRNSVIRDWKSAKAIELREADYKQRRAKYDVEIENPDAKSAVSQ